MTSGLLLLFFTESRRVGSSGCHGAQGCGGSL